MFFKQGRQDALMHKQVVLVRQDLKLGKGKTAAQVAHASLESYKKASQENRELWEADGSKKVVLKVKSLAELLEVRRSARAAKLPNALIRDAGKTEVEPGTVTALAIGPADEHDIDSVAGHLHML